MTAQELALHAEAALGAADVHLGQGTLSLRDEAVWLVLAALGQPLDAFDDIASQPLDAAQQAAVHDLLQRRITTRQPLAYLTGEAWLQGVPFYSDARSIVPRSLIAELIADGGFDAWLGDNTRRVLDLCTGNASLAVLAAMAWPDVSVVGCDLSADALALGARNVQRHDLQGRVTLRQGDLLDPVRADGPFDLVLCNPPYVCQDSMDRLPPEFRAEPRLALDGNPHDHAPPAQRDGMDILRRALPALPALMSPQAVLVLEIGHEIGHFVRAFPGLPAIGLPTSAGEEQVLLLTRGDLAGGHDNASA
ncbi:50S ribosomal protein L3 N(5)-glutamine methyltransferase [Amphibiibacter pelophylacis]|uniref:50S ribosomal protein L3 N(5)-glutamine methyltransferase n=1 Tax=Amphibiibacter pelophylacis TaxID=1799477 RepID=A0ACC6P2U0_9BURK